MKRGSIWLFSSLGVGLTLALVFILFALTPAAARGTQPAPKPNLESQIQDYSEQGYLASNYKQLTDKPTISKKPYQNILLNADNSSYLEMLIKINHEDTIGYSIFPLTDGYCLLNSHAQKQNLTQISSLGVISASKDIDCNSSLTPRSAIQTQDDGYLISGVRNANPQSGYLIKINANLEYQWGMSFQSSNVNIWAAAGRETADGGIIVLLNENKGFGIIKLDTDRNVAWSKRIRIADEDTQTDVYDILENLYINKESQSQCGGYIIYGSVQRLTTDWDLYFAALSCDGNSILWQRIMNNPGWEGSYLFGSAVQPRASNIAIRQDGNGENHQEANLLVAATIELFDYLTKTIMLVPFGVSGETTLSDPPSFDSVKIMVPSNGNYILGPYGGNNLVRLSDDNMLLGGTTFSYGMGGNEFFLVKLDKNLDPIWQSAYGSLNTEVFYGLLESGNNLFVTGNYWGLPVRGASIFMELSQDGENNGEWFARTPTEFTISEGESSLFTPTYMIGNGTIMTETMTCTITDANAESAHIYSIRLPTIYKEYASP